MTKPATENALDQREAERDCYRQLAQATAMDQRNGGRRVDSAQVIPLHLRGCRGDSCHQGHKPCRDRCGAEQAAPDDDLPTLGWATRARLHWTRLLASFRRS